jgi:cell division protease FtsH
MLGGRAAEELFLASITTGAGNDLEIATNLARKMVCDWGMSEKIGPLTFGKKEEHIFLGKEFAQPKDFSEATAVRIDQEIERLVRENYKRARQMLQENAPLVHELASALLEKEVLDGSEVRQMVEDYVRPGEQTGQEKAEKDDQIGGESKDEAKDVSVLSPKLS